MPIRSTRLSLAAVVVVAAAAFAASCARAPREDAPAKPVRVAGTEYMVKDTTVDATFDAAGVAGPMRQATLSTKLMGTVLAVLVHEGDVVAAGQPLVRIDARDLAAKESQVAASVAEADAVHRDAVTQANRIRALYTDSVATRAQLDAAETGLARATAGLAAARGAAAELGAVSDYSVVRAPFAGVVTKRFVDPGAFAAPGAPLVSVQDESTLRLSVSATPDIVGSLRRGDAVDAAIEERTVRAVVEGVVPAAAGNLYTVNALVANPGRALLAGSTATIRLPLGERRALVVPAAAIVREGDLTGVVLRTGAGDERRWVRLGRTAGSLVEVTAGVRAGDRVVVPPASTVAEGN